MKNTVTVKEISIDQLNQYRDERNKGIVRINYVTELRRNESGEKINNDTTFNSGRFSLDMRKDFFQRGFLVKYPHGIIASYGMISNNMANIKVFRGENKHYSDITKSSLGRTIKDDDSEEDVYRRLVVGQAKINIFKDTLIKAQIPAKWNFGDIFAYVIAQHYGLKTQYIDLTDDVEAALFFACTKYVNGKYEPILNTDMKEYGEYGYIYIGIDNMIRQIGKPHSTLDRISMAGYQPFRRCHRQRGYFIDTNENDNFKDYCLLKTSKFKKYKFKRTEKLSLEIYNKFSGGDYFFPPKEKDMLEELLKEIENINTFTYAEIVKANISLNNKYDTNTVIKSMEKEGLKIEKEIKRNLNISKLKEFDLKKFINREGIVLGTRYAY